MRVFVAVVLTACAVEPFAMGPEVWDDPVFHDDAGDWLFTDRIGRIDLDVDPDAEAILRSERVMTQKTWVTAEAVIDGEEVGPIGLKLRGGSGSFQGWDAKPKLKLDFNRVTGERFHGLEALSLNNAKMDCSAIGEAMAARVFAEAGVPTSRAGWAQLFVNGADYGLYLVVEPHDDRFLGRAFGDADATLYDGSYQWAGWLPYFLDFGQGRDDRFDQDEGPDVDFADIARISAGVVATLDTGERPPDLVEAVDWEAFHRFVATDQWLGNEDGYPTNRNNYHLVFPETGPMTVVPWDLDATFRQDDATAWTDPKGQLFAACLVDEACQTRHRDVAREIADVMDGLDWDGQFDAFLALTRVGVDGDPRRRCSDDDLAARRARIGEWGQDSGARLRSAWR